MDDKTQYFFALLRSFLHETAPPKAIEVEWEEIYNLAHIHHVSGAVYVAIQKLNKEEQPKEDILEKFKAEFFGAFIMYQKQKKVCDEITSKLAEEKIQHIFLKGSVVKEYYPVKAMRTLGDIDLLIHEDDQEAAKKALVEIGYNNLSCNPGSTWDYEKNNLRVEVHDKLIYSEIHNKFDFFDYFNNVWENSKQSDEAYRYELILEFHLIFLLTHMAKHFCYSGCGVRMFLDIAVILIKFNENINFDYFWNEIKKIKLENFVKNIFAICKKYFNVNMKKLEKYFQIEIEYNKFEIISNNIVRGGVFGASNLIILSYIIRKEFEKTSNMKLAKIKILTRILFLNYKYMKTKFPVLSNFPFLLPFFWFARGFFSMITRSKRTVGILKELTAKPSGGAEESYEVLKEIGLLE